MILATWNLQRAKKQSARYVALRRLIDEQAADVWVLTETRDDFSPGLLPAQQGPSGRWKVSGPGLIQCFRERSPR
jgi:hypothetical protein